jgi:hypothetical protein
MSVHKPGHRLSLQAERALIAKKLVSFAHSKNVVLDLLHDMYKRAPKTERFDADKSWNSLTHIADGYLGSYKWAPRINAVGANDKFLGAVRERCA